MRMASPLSPLWYLGFILRIPMAVVVLLLGLIIVENHEAVLDVAEDILYGRIRK